MVQGSHIAAKLKVTAVHYIKKLLLTCAGPITKNQSIPNKRLPILQTQDCYKLLTTLISERRTNINCAKCSIYDKITTMCL